MGNLADYSAFVAVAEQGSLTAAASYLGRSLQAVSRSLGGLEKDLGVALVQRTTRRSQLTGAGQAFLARVRPALADLALARSEAAEGAARVSGRIRVAGPAIFGVLELTPLLARFMQRHPEVDVELLLGEAYADLASGAIDLAMRLGDLPDSGLTARRLGSLRQVVFGAPAYFAEHGWPQAPGDLAAHSCVIRVSAQDPTSWRFRRDGRVVEAPVTGRFRSDSPAACNAAAVNGLGIARAPLWQVRDHVDAGRVAVVLADYGLDAMPIHLVWPSGPLPVRVRLLIDHIASTIDLSRL